MATQPLPGTSLTPYNSGFDFTASDNPEDNNYGLQVSGQAQGDIFDQELRDYGNQGIGREDEARTRLETLYWELLTQPGLSEDEKAQYLQQARLEGLEFTPEEIQSFGLQDWEQTQIQGDPYNALNSYYNPAHYDDVQTSGASNIRGAVSNLRGSLDTAVGELRAGVGGAIDQDRLRQDPAYRAQIMAELEAGSSSATDAVFDPGLDITDRYLSKRGYSDDDVQTMAEAAARDVGLRHRAAIVDLERSANRAGISDPYAIAAGRSRYERQAAPLSADARTDAQIAAMEKQKLAEQDIQDTQLEAGGRRAGLRSSVALNLLGQRTGALEDMERGRIGAEQGLTSARLQGAGMVGDAAYRSASEGGQANISNERDIRNIGLQGEEWKTGTALPAAERAESLTAGRAAGIAENRQGVARDVAGNRQGTSRYVGEQLSSRTGDIANARRGDQREVRGYYGGQQDYAGNQYAQSMANRLANRVQTTGATQGAAAQQQAWQGRKKWWEPLVQAGVDAALGAATGGLSGGKKSGGSASPEPYGYS